MGHMQIFNSALPSLSSNVTNGNSNVLAFLNYTLYFDDSAIPAVEWREAHNFSIK